MLSATQALADVADERAVRFCVAKDANFVKVDDCLPDAHVAFASFDAIHQIYGDAGQDLTSRCLEVNKGDYVGAATCGRTAIEAAINLAAKLPAGTEIPDPLFKALKNPADMERLTSAIKSARAVFPDKQFWGGGMYRPLK
ncbi:MAG: hypothetical protein AAGB15_15460 [Pseudomonadota bacterium]